MIRTRDFLLYMLVLLFLFIGIGFTVTLEGGGDGRTISEQVALLTTDGTDVTAQEAGAGIDREANVAQLREKLARGEGQIAQGPPVLYSVDSPATSVAPTESENPDTLLEETDREPRYCPNMQRDATLAANWPREGVVIELLEGARIVRTTATEADVQGTSTATTTPQQRVLMQLPVSPPRSFSSHCLDSEIIGVALDGSLIKNDETWRFRAASSESVIGYARDGFPIYGQGVDEAQLDACGGYDPGVGYRYHLRETELFVLGCFAGEPQQFIE